MKSITRDELYVRWIIEADATGIIPIRGEVWLKTDCERDIARGSARICGEASFKPRGVVAIEVTEELIADRKFGGKTLGSIIGDILDSAEARFASDLKMINDPACEDEWAVSLRRDLGML